MNIIPVISQLITKIFEAAEDFMEEPTRFAELEATLKDASNSGMAAVMQAILEEYDTVLRDVPHRSQRYTIQRHDDRSLITTFGDVRYSRTYYWDKEARRHVYLLDEAICLPPDEHFSEQAEIELLVEATKTSYQHAADSLRTRDQTVSKTAVMNKVHAVVEEMPIEEAPVRKRCQYLYIEADEDHIDRQKAEEEKRGSCLLGKMIYVYEGKEDVCKGRRKLVRPFYFGGLYAGSPANGQLWDRVQEYIRKTYDEEFLERVYICSDGGGWIKAGHLHIDKSVLVADRYHLMMYINRMSNLMLDERELVKGKFYKYIYKDKPRKVKKLLRRMRKSVGEQKALQDGENYLLNNWEEIQRAFHDEHVQGCSAEGHVSHLYSDRMSSRPMGWSETGADRMCRLRCARASGGDEKIVDLVKYRRAKAMEEVAATGTDGAAIDLKPAKRRYTKRQLETAAYAERMHGTLGSSLVRKELAIRYHLAGI